MDTWVFLAYYLVIFRDSNPSTEKNAFFDIWMFGKDVYNKNYVIHDIKSNYKMLSEKTKHKMEILICDMIIYFKSNSIF